MNDYKIIIESLIIELDLIYMPIFDEYSYLISDPINVNTNKIMVEFFWTLEQSRAIDIPYIEEDDKTLQWYKDFITTKIDTLLLTSARNEIISSYLSDSEVQLIAQRFTSELIPYIEETIVSFPK